MVGRRRASDIVAAFAAGCVCAVLAPPGVSAGDRLAYRVGRVGSPIRLDGRADEPAWSNAELITDFGVPANANGSQPAARTRARLLWDHDHLYFVAELEDAEIVVASRRNDDRLCA